MSAKARLLWVSVAVVIVDLATKAWVVAAIPRHAVRPVIPGLLNVTHVQNTGVAFGLLDGLGAAGPAILIAAGALALLVVAIYFRQTASEERLLLWSLALILGGAVGNLVDRIAHRAVTDFIDFYVGSYHWHTFNVADSAITVGIGLMLLDLVLQRRNRPVEA